MSNAVEVVAAVILALASPRFCLQISYSHQII